MSNQTPSSRVPLAIVGIGCRLPGGIATPADYWRRLCEGFDAIRPVPRERWDSRLFYSPDLSVPRRIVFNAGGFIDQDLRGFDARFFGITAREAAVLDPQQRLLLEIAWECLEDALVVPASLEGSATGVFIGSFGVDHGVIQQSTQNLDQLDAHIATGATTTMLAARLSHALDLRGPCVSFDTACSASLVAFHYACQAIWHGECDMALTGGANIMLSPTSAIPPSKGHFFSPDSRSKAFDASADGYGRGEGAGIVLLRRLEDAQRDGDRIYAVVPATGVNHDGRTQGVFVPNGAAQTELLKRVHGLASNVPVQYVEAHGTGTPLGDPTELQALSDGLGLTPQAPVYVGSVKANLGHLEAAAGTVGLIKAALALYHRQIPPHIGMKEPNPKIAFDALGVRVPQALLSWPDHAGPARACVNSFGYGGTNAHAVLEQAPAAGEEPPASSAAACLFLPLSARDGQALQAVAARTLELVKNQSRPPLADLISTHARHRAHHHQRLAVVARDADELERNLTSFVERGGSQGNARGEAPYGPPPRLAFVYTGMGPQTYVMGAQLSREFPVFARTFRHSLELLSNLHGASLFKVLESAPSAKVRVPTALAQWLNFALQRGLTDLFQSFGVTPDVLLGHSVGEIPAALAASALTIEDATLIAYHRGRLQQDCEGLGGMLAVELSEAALHELGSPAVQACEVAAVNAPASLTLAGPLAELEKVQALCDERGIFSRLLNVGVPYHSRVMDRIREPFLAALAAVRPEQPCRMLISSVTGEVEGARDANYWWRNVREKVAFERAVTRLGAESPLVVLQLGPHAVLTPSLKACFEAQLQVPPILCSLYRDRPEPQGLLEALGGLYCAGVKLDWERLAPAGRRVFGLPQYPWQREQHWHESEASLRARCGPSGHVLLQQPVPSSVPTWHTELTEGYFSYLQDHRAEDRAIFPAAALVEIALAVNQALRGSERARLEHLSFRSALLLGDAMCERIEIRFDPTSGTFSVSRRLDDSQGSWPVVCSGHISEYRPEPEPDADLATARAGYVPLEGSLYLERSQSYFYYGPRFRSMRRLSCLGEHFITELELPPDANPEGDRYAIHPSLLDGALQGAVVIAQQVLTRGNQDGILVPISLDRFDFFEAPGNVAWCHGRVRDYTTTSLELDLELFGASGRMCARLTGLRWGFVRTRHDPSPEEVRELLYVATATPVDAPVTPVATPTGAGHWLLLGRDADALGVLAETLAPRSAQLTSLKLGDAASAAELETLLDTAPVRAASGIVYLASGAAPLAANPAEAAIAEVSLALGVLTALTNLGVTPRTALVTLGAEPVSQSECPRPELSALWGLGRAVGNERGGAELLLIDLPQTPDASDWQGLAAELVGTTARRQMLVREGKPLLVSFAPAKVAASASAEARLVPTSESVALSQQGGQRLENLGWAARPRRAPGPGEVELQVTASAVNFKDLMKATGLISDAVTRGSFLGEQLGMECAGRVVRVGQGVTAVESGDQVVAITSGSFASYVTCSAALLAPPLPNSTAEQSVVYATFATVVRALEQLAQLDTGERILIHSAAGALGLAAIQYAQWRGARIFATASSQRKRDYLLSLGVEQVADSRSLAFVDEVRAWSAGKGVDVVLNFLAGEARLQSIALLASGGRFVDVGKPGGVRDAQLPARLFNTNMSFANVDLDQLLRNSPQKLARLTERVIELFRLGHFRPLPVQVFEPDQVQAAFQLMARSEHIGKVVLGFEGKQVTLAAQAPSPIRDDATYLVSGGFGGFGLSICRILAERGARSIVVLSRSGPTSPNAKRLALELEQAGVTLHDRRGDVGSPSDVTELVRWIQTELPPLRGVVHAAMQLDDGVFTAMTPERVERVMHAKARGAWALHRATQSLQLDLFVLFSSIASMTGGVGQSNYAAANAFLDGLARHRRGLGLSATAIDWGVLSDSGVVAQNPELRRLLADQGVLGISDPEAMAALDLVVAGTLASVGCIKLDWDLLASAAPAAGASPFLADLLRAATPSQERVPEGLRRLLEQLAEHRENPLEVVEMAVGTLVATVLRTSFERVELRRPLSVAGVDSLMATELSVALFREYGIRFTVLDLLRTLSVADVAKAVLGKTRPAAPS